MIPQMKIQLHYSPTLLIVGANNYTGLGLDWLVTWRDQFEVFDTEDEARHFIFYLIETESRLDTGYFGA